jgi:hypothetical protein
VKALRRAVAAVLTGVLLIFLAETATAAILVVDRGHARGDQAILTVGGSVDEPRRLWIKVKARPNQVADGAWVVLAHTEAWSGNAMEASA